ncbi:MAG: DUF6508 domain-containing protein [Bacteroidetes bacterium]|nr:DUF6508 domain-containing protein [Bacteroidota bacterium]
MKEFPEFQQHLTTLKSKDWQKLFALIPEIENTKIFGKISKVEKDKDGVQVMPYMISSEVVDKFYNVVYELEILPNFDWMNWKEAKPIIDDESFDYNELETITLCKLLTFIIRADRFSEGVLVSCFTNGSILKIILSLRDKINGTN